MLGVCPAWVSGRVVIHAAISPQLAIEAITFASAPPVSMRSLGTERDDHPPIAE